MRPRLIFTLLWLLIPALTRAEFIKFPYLQSLTDTSVSICWQQSEPAPANLHYGLTPAMEQILTDTSHTTLHQVSITGLLPDTLYFYRVIALLDSSPVRQFRTPGTQLQRFRVVVYGDCRTDSATHQQVVNRIRQLNPAPLLLFNSGDLTDNGSDSCYQIFFNTTRDLLAGLCLFPALGNHELGNISNYFRLFVLPENERFYSVRVANTIFIILDNYSDFQSGTPQYQWLVEKLQSANNDPTIAHLFVIFHEPPYTTSAGHSGNQAVQQYLCPLFEQFAISAVFCGHIHAYEHSLVNGIHYFITGGGGAPLHTRWLNPAPWTVYREAVYHFLIIDVRADTATIYGVRLDGTQFDTTRVINQQGIQHPETPLPPSPSLLLTSPTANRTKITIISSRTAKAVLSVYDASGRKIYRLNPLNLKPGENSLTCPLPGAGLYFLMLKTPDQLWSSRMLIL
ncbi:MAG: metallophosphoesterase [candidate division WOR-3 bacterium]